MPTFGPAFGPAFDEFSVPESLIEGLITAIVSPFQDLETAAQACLTQRDIYTAFGVQQDVIGRIVGQPRNGLDDPTYQRYLLARIATNRSRGTTEDVINVVRLVVNDPSATIAARNEGPATMRVFVSGIPVADALAAIVFSFATSAASAGVRIVLEWSNFTPGDTYTLDIGPGLDVGHLASAEG